MTDPAISQAAGAGAALGPVTYAQHLEQELAHTRRLLSTMEHFAEVADRVEAASNTAHQERALVQARLESAAAHLRHAQAAAPTGEPALVEAAGVLQLLDPPADPARRRVALDPADEARWVIRDALSTHRYESHRPGSDRPSDPGWHPCPCGWQGYWSSFEPHVAEHVCAALLAAPGLLPHLTALAARSQG